MGKCWWPFLSLLGAGAALLPTELPLSGAALVGAGLSHTGPCSPGHREEPKDKGVLGVPGAQEEYILCKERGGGEAQDADGHPGAVLEGAALVELRYRAGHSPSWSKWVSVP